MKDDFCSDILIIKILIVGDPGVGKSNFIYRYMRDKFSGSNLSTAGFEANSKEIEITDKKIILQLWDSAGQEKFKSITKNLFTRVQGIIILYDITNKQSFLNISNWIKNIKEEDDTVPFTVAGNKCDLEMKREVPIEEATKYCDENNVDFLETSAKENINVMECISNFVTKILNSENFNKNNGIVLESSSLGKSNSIDKNERCC